MKYFELIISNHAQEKILSRGIKMEDIWKTIKYVNRTKKGKYGGTEFEKEFEEFKITVQAVLNNKNRWVVKSAWRNPPLPGTFDAKQKSMWKKYNKSGFLGQLWIQIKQQFGRK